jgi:hypothetical protein
VNIDSHISSVFNMFLPMKVHEVSGTLRPPFLLARTIKILTNYITIVMFYSIQSDCSNFQYKDPILLEPYIIVAEKYSQNAPHSHPAGHSASSHIIRATWYLQTTK